MRRRSGRQGTEPSRGCLWMTGGSGSGLERECSAGVVAFWYVLMVEYFVSVSFGVFNALYAVFCILAVVKIWDRKEIDMVFK